MTPLGLYLHVPFCRRRCPYCDFAIHTGATEDLRARYVAALRRELAHALPNAPGPLTTMFWGGGTPTALSVTQLRETLCFIFDTVEIAPNAEISIEANPEDLTPEALHALREAGFNRLSLGAQNLDDAVLRGLGRAHRAADVERVVSDARRAGWDNLSFDLIFGLPLQSRESWRATLQRAGELAPDHVSCYSLTIEQGTPFARRVAKGEMQPLSSDQEAELLHDAQEVLSTFGIERYEVSNYARVGFECCHNLNYWRGGDYLACGAGAHGHLNGHRWWNERATPRYVSLIGETGTARAGEEHLDAEQRLDERLMMGLRLREGVAWRVAAQRLGVATERREAIAQRLSELVRKDVAHEDNGVVQLSPASVAVADAVAVRLLT